MRHEQNPVDRAQYYESQKKPQRRAVPLFKITHQHNQRYQHDKSAAGRRKIQRLEKNLVVIPRRFDQRQRNQRRQNPQTGHYQLKPNDPSQNRNPPPTQQLTAARILKPNSPLNNAYFTFIISGIY